MFGLEERGSHRGPGLHVAEKPCVRSSLECSSSRFAISSFVVAFVVKATNFSLCAAGITLHQPTFRWSFENDTSSTGFSHFHQQTTPLPDRSVTLKAPGRAEHSQPLAP
jgi:hypothetical protein